MVRGHECIGHDATFVSFVSFVEVVGSAMMGTSTGHLFSGPGMSIVASSFRNT